MNHEEVLKRAHKGPKSTDLFDFAGRWVNKHGSELDLKIEGAILTGTFSCKDDEGPALAASLTGYVVADLISMVALWTKSTTITAWSGQLLVEGDKQVLKLMWRLITEMPEPEESRYFWMSSYAGAEEFVKE